MNDDPILADPIIDGDPIEEPTAAGDVPEPVVLYFVCPGASFDRVPACDLTQTMIDKSGMTVDEILAVHIGEQPLYARAYEVIKNG